MEELNEEERHIREYLLGYLDEVARETVEERLMTDPDYQEKVLIVESELIEEYSDGMLSERDRERFCKYILTTEKQADKLLLTRALGTQRVTAAANSPPVAKVTTRPLSLKRRLSDLFLARSRTVKLSTVTLILIVFVGVALAIIVLLRNYASNKSNSLAQEVAKLNAQENLDPEALSHGSIIGPIKPGLFRGEEGGNKFSMTDTEGIAQLRLQIGAGDYQSFQAVLLTDEGREIVTINDLKAKMVNGERVIIIYLPARILTPGDYELKLSGLTSNNQLKDLNRYTFRIFK